MKLKSTIVATAAALLMATTAQAASRAYTFYDNGYWKTFGMSSNNDGDTMCGMQAGDYNSRVYFKWTKYGMTVQVWKANWRLAKDTKVPFKLEFFDNAKPDQSSIITVEAGLAKPEGIGTSVFMDVDASDEASLMKVFGDADNLTISFPQGDEPAWHARMDGSRKAAKQFMDCIDATQQIQAMSHPTSPVAPAQPVVPSQPAPAQLEPTTSEMLFVIPPDVSGGHMNVRNGPGANHGLLGAIPAGQTVRASRCARRDDGIAGADWCLITWNGLTGWVSQVGLMPVTPQPTQPVARAATSKDDGGI